MSDELTALIAELEREVEPLERALRLREAEEARALKAEEARLSAALARQDKAAATLQAEAAQRAALEARHAELRRITEGWRGQLWRIGYGTLSVTGLMAALAAFLVVVRWFGTIPAWGMLGAQVVAFGLLCLLIPRKT